MKHNPHGGDVFAAARTLGARVEDLIDFSANINPLGFPDNVRTAVMDTFPLLRHYPDPKCVDLTRAIARQKNLSPDQVLVGNGSTELIYLVGRALSPRRAMIVGPAFSEYERGLDLAGVEIEYYNTLEENQFTLTGAPDTGAAELVFLANPGNPSGTLIPVEPLKDILTAFESRGIWTILDEAFIDFFEEGSMAPFLDSFPHLVILRSFTKFYGLPGLRLGYIMAGEPVVDRFLKVAEPWSVNVMAQAAGLACLDNDRYAAETKALITEARTRLADGLARIPGLKVFPGRANYLLVKLTRSDWTAARLKEALIPRNILIRNADNFIGLNQQFFRVAVRLPEENDRLLQAIQACLKG